MVAFFLVPVPSLRVLTFVDHTPSVREWIQEDDDVRTGKTEPDPANDGLVVEGVAARVYLDQIMQVGIRSREPPPPSPYPSDLVPCSPLLSPAPLRNPPLTSSPPPRSDRKVDRGRSEGSAAERDAGAPPTASTTAYHATPNTNACAGTHLIRHWRRLRSSAS